MAGALPGTYSGGGPPSGHASVRRTVMSAFEAAEQTASWAVERSDLKVGNALNQGTHAVVFSGVYKSVVLRGAAEATVPERVYNAFVNECALLHAMQDHPNVVRFVGVCFEPPNLCIVTELMTNGSLFDLLHGTGRRRGCPPTGPLGVSLVLRLASDIAAGLGHLHSHAVIHRDVKSANLLLTADDRVKVADFGVARKLAPVGDMTAETGTYRWMAPEVILHQRYDERVDVFSFAIVAWELLTGRVPYDQLSPVDAAAAVAQGARPALPEAYAARGGGGGGGGGGHPLGALLARCWDARPQLRPSFVDVLRELAAME